jgi:citrate synthase
MKFPIKNKSIEKSSVSSVSNGTIIVDGHPLERIVESLSYEELLFFKLQNRNPTAEQAKKLSKILTQEILPESLLYDCAFTYGTFANRLTSLLNNLNSNPTMMESLKLPESIDPELKPGIIALNSAPKIAALQNNRQPIHNAERYIESIFLNNGVKPSMDQFTLLDTYLTSLVEHGMTSPSYHGFRTTANSQASYSAALISWLQTADAPLHFGALGLAMEDLSEIVRKGETPKQFISKIFEEGKYVNGAGHRIHNYSQIISNPPHSQPDPRVRIMFDVAENLNHTGGYTHLVYNISESLARHKKKLCLNVDMAGAGLLLDLGFSSKHAIMFPFIGRSLHLNPLYLEESNSKRAAYIGLEERTFHKPQNNNFARDYSSIEGMFQDFEDSP